MHAHTQIVSQLVITAVSINKKKFLLTFLNLDLMIVIIKKNCKQMSLTKNVIFQPRIFFKVLKCIQQLLLLIVDVANCIFHVLNDLVSPQNEKMISKGKHHFQD